MPANIRRKVSHEPSTPFPLGRVVTVIAAPSRGINSEIRLIPSVIWRFQNDSNLLEIGNDLSRVLDHLLQFRLHPQLSYASGCVRFNSDRNGGYGSHGRLLLPKELEGRILSKLGQP